MQIDYRDLSLQVLRYQHMISQSVAQNNGKRNVCGAYVVSVLVQNGVRYFLCHCCSSSKLYLINDMVNAIILQDVLYVAIPLANVMTFEKFVATPLKQ